ncbi:calcium homeostasis modulator protein 4-like isoform X2 [Epinephelus moara]|nr:calcium homeostasis modulator protein 4-like isoform X2 [Epinephelus moara]XP_049929213.1 calcium homeostasis modulator protein 4-like isoform X2 [Epinephelus moara]
MADLQAMASTASREGRPALISHVRSEFKKSALVSSAFFGVILLCLEKFIEKEFACPCKVGSNTAFATAYLIVPAVVVFLLMMNIKDFKCGMSQKEIWKTVASSFVPAMFWIIIVLWDGHCVACMKTTWSGSYVEIDKAAPQKWCKPANLTPSQELDYKNETQHWFFMSQCIGMAMIASLTFILLFKCCRQQEDSQQTVISHQVNDNRDATDYIPL